MASTRGREQRVTALHGPKRQFLGNRAGYAPPSWRTNVAGPSSRPVNPLAEPGSKIFISKLPVDVGEKEVEDLFRMTVGPLRESFLVYNSQGKSKGMAVVAFQRPGDALVAKAKYDGKVVDGRRTIKIEIMTDSNNPYGPAPPRPPQSLLERIAPIQIAAGTSAPNGTVPVPPVPNATRVPPKKQPNPPRAAPVASAAPLPPRRIKTKKGPKRLKKRQPVTVDDLDKEMEDYRAAAPEYGENQI
ncbi:hypothetical protein CPC08DRAFT_714211 [Agrocybe pediades]|nr:hypothetical protein CPC08DRAFT_714211 [Agrocybe pediades]